MRAMGIGADIMSLGGIAIAIGEMIDAAIVMIENMHKHLERRIRAAGPSAGEDRRCADAHLRAAGGASGGRWSLDACKEVGPALFFSLLIITVSFLPVFALEGAGRAAVQAAGAGPRRSRWRRRRSCSHHPRPRAAWGSSSAARIHPEDRNPLIARADPRLPAGHRAGCCAGAWPVVARRAGGAHPDLDPLPAASAASSCRRSTRGRCSTCPRRCPASAWRRPAELLQRQDSILKSVPEVASVFGKAGRANTATDPAGLDMAETTIVLKPARMAARDDDGAAGGRRWTAPCACPGVTNAWTMPIQGRIDMLATGIRTPVGIKLFGPDLRGARAAREGGGARAAHRCRARAAPSPSAR